MIKIKRAKNRQFYFVVLAKNHKVILTSETYKSKAGVWKGIMAITGILNNAQGSKKGLEMVGFVKDETQTT